MTEINWTSREVTPAPMVCPNCKQSSDKWAWNDKDQEWGFDDEWWRDPLNDAVDSYTCSRECYVARWKLYRDWETCRGRERKPNLCTCRCYGCRHHCGAHYSLDQYRSHVDDGIDE